MTTAFTLLPIVITDTAAPTDATKPAVAAPVNTVKVVLSSAIISTSLALRYAPCSTMALLLSLTLAALTAWPRSTPKSPPATF